MPKVQRAIPAATSRIRERQRQMRRIVAVLVLAGRGWWSEADEARIERLVELFDQDMTDLAAIDRFDKAQSGVFTEGYQQ